MGELFVWCKKTQLLLLYFLFCFQFMPLTDDRLIVSGAADNQVTVQLMTLIIERYFCS